MPSITEAAILSKENMFFIPNSLAFITIGKRLSALFTAQTSPKCTTISFKAQRFEASTT